MNDFIIKCCMCGKEYSFKNLLEQNFANGAIRYILDIDFDGAIQKIECECSNIVKIIE